MCPIRIHYTVYIKDILRDINREDVGRKDRDIFLFSHLKAGSVGEFDDCAGGDGLGLIVDQDELVLVAYVYVDDSLRTAELCVLVHLRHCRLSERLFGKSAHPEPVVLGGFTLYHTDYLVVALREYYFCLSYVGVGCSLTGNAAACQHQHRADQACQ